MRSSRPFAQSHPRVRTVVLLGVCALMLAFAAGCSSPDEDAGAAADVPTQQQSAASEAAPAESAQATIASEPDASAESQKAADEKDAMKDAAKDAATDSASDAAAAPDAPDPDALFEALDVTEDYRAGFVHGEKSAEYQRYIVLHDTEGGDSAQNIIDWWDSNGNLVAAHFIVNKDGSIWQCVPLDKIAHHAGYGDTGHNVEFGTNNESRDDKKGSQPIGDWAADYGMNSYSIGIEMVHQGGEGDYPKAQLKAVDALIAYIDAYYGFESQIIDHKAWRSGNSDTSEEFAPYLKSYQQKRTHK